MYSWPRGWQMTTPADDAFDTVGAWYMPSSGFLELPN
jgi:hypothetical protein